MMQLRNPECLWERTNDAGVFDRFDVESRIGPVSEPVECLAGGLANLDLEIHALRFPQAGLLNAPLDLGTPYPDVLGIFSDYALSQLDRAPSGAAREIRRRVEALLVAHADAMRHLAHSSVLLHGDFKVSNLNWADSGGLLVLDWEFAYSGSSLMDIGQLIRWGASPSFIEGFARSYRGNGGALPEDWQRWAAAFDVFNLAGLLAGAAPGSRRATDVARRIDETLADLQ